jgi:hypothetical protein
LPFFRLDDLQVELGSAHRRSFSSALPIGVAACRDSRRRWRTRDRRRGRREIEERKIANVTRHKNITVLRRYIRAATAFDDVGEVL